MRWPSMLKTLFNTTDDAHDDSTPDTTVDDLAHEYATTDMTIDEYEARVEERLLDEAFPELSPTTDQSVIKSEIDEQEYPEGSPQYKYLVLLREYATARGEAPTMAEVEKAKSLPSPTTYRHQFGSWQRTLMAAGLMDEPLSEKYNL